MHSFSTLLRFIWRSGKRAAVFVVGVALVAVGLVMFVTPGPGIVLVVAGLAILATEFAWAEHLLDKAKVSAAKAGKSAQRVPGVATVTSAAGRLVPARFRRTRTTVVVADTDGVVVQVVDVAVVEAEIAGGDGETGRPPDAADPPDPVDTPAAADPPDPVDTPAAVDTPAPARADASDRA